MTAPDNGMPPGWRASTLADPFEVFVGPIWEQGEKGARRFALRVLEDHMNMRGIVHGGMLMTFADATLGAAAADLSGGAWPVTVNLQTQFLRPAHLGDLIEVAPELTRRTRGFLFLRGDFLVKGEIAMTASSVWKLTLSRLALP